MDYKIDPTQIDRWKALPPDKRQTRIKDIVNMHNTVTVMNLIQVLWKLPSDMTVMIPSLQIHGHYGGIKRIRTYDGVTGIIYIDNGED